jgi:hypothetical protein
MVSRRRLRRPPRENSNSDARMPHGWAIHRCTRSRAPHPTWPRSPQRRERATRRPRLSRPGVRPDAASLPSETPDPSETPTNPVPRLVCCGRRDRQHQPRGTGVIWQSARQRNACAAQDAQRAPTTRSSSDGFHVLFGATTSAYGDVLDPAMLRHASSWVLRRVDLSLARPPQPHPSRGACGRQGPRSYQARRSMPARSRPACADRESDQAVGHLAATLDLDQNRTRRRNQTYALREPTAGSARGGGYAHCMVV